MARTSLEKDSLTAKLKDIESLISPKMAKKLTLEDLESLSNIADKIAELLSNTVGKLVPNAIKTSNYSSSPAATYKANGLYIGAKPSNDPIGIASLTEPIVISADLGTGFSSGGISLFDVTEEVNSNLVTKKVIETIEAQTGAVVEEKPVEDEYGRLNDIFASVEDQV